MQLQPVSFNGIAINDGTNFISGIAGETPMQPLVSPVFVRRAGAFPVYAGKEFLDQFLQIEVACQGDFNEQLETLNSIFSVTDETPRQFIVKDISDSDTQYYIYATPRSASPQFGTTVIITLAIADPIWRSVNENSQTWNITASGQSTDFAVSGNIDAYPVLEITPTSLPSEGYVYRRFIRLIPQSAYANNNRPVCISNTTDGAGLDTAALVTAGKAQATGADFLVFVNGVSVERWFGETTDTEFNTAATRIWVNLSLPPKREATIRDAIASTDTVTSITLQNTDDNRLIMSALPNASRLLIGAEEFSYRGKTITQTVLRLNNVLRARRGTSAAGHSAGATATEIPFDISYVYGSSDAVAVNPPITRKPIIDLSLSDNSSFVYDKFWHKAQPQRTGQWTPARVSVTNNKLSQSNFYTDDNNTSTDPADVAGMRIANFQQAGVWKAETANIQWSNYFADGVASIAHNYERFQRTASWANIAGVQLSRDNTNWETGITYATVGSASFNTWLTGLSTPSTDITILSDARYARYIFNGSITKTANNSAALGITGAVIGLSNPPLITIAAEASNFQMQFTLANTQTGQSMEVLLPVSVDQTVTIDTDPNFPYARHDGQYVNNSVALSSIRADWLKFGTGTNTLTYTATQTGNVTIIVKWQTRYNFK